MEILRLSDPGTCVCACTVNVNITARKVQKTARG